MAKTRNGRVVKTCPNCGKTFEVFRSHAAQFRYCSPGCRDEFKKKTNWTNRRCERCGHAFCCRKSSKKNFCTLLCALKARAGTGVKVEREKYGRLRIVGIVPRERNPNGCNGAYYECLCSCGNKLVVSVYKLKIGHTRSCGCWGRDTNSKKMKGIRPPAGNKDFLCAVCGKSVVGKSRRRKYCSDDCKYAGWYASNKNRKCKRCGVDFIGDYWSNECPPCHEIVVAEHHRAGRAKLKRDRDKVCIRCGREFKGWHNQKCCSRSCMKIRWRREEAATSLGVDLVSLGIALKDKA
jgi:hypothetical protein